MQEDQKFLVTELPHSIYNSLLDMTLGSHISCKHLYRSLLTQASVSITSHADICVYHIHCKQNAWAETKLGKKGGLILMCVVSEMPVHPGREA